jgi:hypothetical protein
MQMFVSRFCLRPCCQKIFDRQQIPETVARLTLI